MTRYEIEVYANDMGTLTEKVVVEGTGISLMDTVDNGALYIVLGARGTIQYAVPLSRFKSMRALPKTTKLKEAPIELVRGIKKPAR